MAERGRAPDRSVDQLSDTESNDTEYREMSPYTASIRRRQDTIKEASYLRSKGVSCRDIMDNPGLTWKDRRRLIHQRYAAYVFNDLYAKDLALYKRYDHGGRRDNDEECKECELVR